MTLDATGVHLRGLARQHVPWDRIAAVEARGGAVKLRLVNGRSKLLRAPVDGPLQSDPEFAAKVETLRRWHRKQATQVS